MDLDLLLERNRLGLINVGAATTPRETRAHDQFAREYAEQTRMTRDALLGSTK
jgi:hypothetical protein